MFHLHIDDDGCPVVNNKRANLSDFESAEPTPETLEYYGIDPVDYEDIYHCLIQLDSALVAERYAVEKDKTNLTLLFDV